MTALVCFAALSAAAVSEASFRGTGYKIAFASDRATDDVGRDVRGGSRARRDLVIVRDDGIAELYALDGMLLYGRMTDVGPNDWQPVTTRRWMRVVNGRQLEAQGVPATSQPVSIGRDATGRVVAVLDRFSGGEVERWWLYDIASDTARPVSVPAEKACTVESVAVWRGRIAYAARCPWFNYRWRVVIRDGAKTTRVTKRGWRVKMVVLRNRSLAVLVSGSKFEQTVWRVLDRGRLCPKAISGTQDEYGIWPGLGSGTLTWAIAGYTFDFVWFDPVEVGDIDLSGRCQPAPRKRYMPRSLLPQPPIHGSPYSNGPAVDGRNLYYATDTALHRLQLPARREPR
jgi:hypothetical protein